MVDSKHITGGLASLWRKCRPVLDMLPVLAAALLIFAVCVYREPAEIGNGRAMLLRSFGFGACVVFAILLWDRAGALPALLFSLGCASAFVPIKTNYSMDALTVFVFGFVWYLGLLVIFEAKPSAINYVLCAIATAHTAVVVSGGHLMTNPNEESALFALCFASFLVLPGWLRLFAVIPAAGACFIPSANGIVAIVVILIAYLTYLSPWLWYVHISAAVMAGCLFVTFIDAGAATVRFAWWGPALEVWKANWLNGCGLGNWKSLAGYMVSAGKIPDGCLRLHNTWIQLLVEMGVKVVPVVVLYAFSMARNVRGIHIAHTLGIIAFLVVSNTNSVFRMNIVNGLVIISLIVRYQLGCSKQRNA